MVLNLGALNPSAGSCPLARNFSQSMSLYRAGLELASFLPLGIAVAGCPALGFTDVSPVFTLPLQVKATYFLIEPASESTPPLALHAYPSLLFNYGLPDGQGKPVTILDRF